MAIKKKDAESSKTDVFSEDQHTEQEAVKTTAKKEKVEKEEAEDMVPMSSVVRMMSDLEAKLMDRFGLGVKSKTVAVDDSYVDELMDDWMETPAVFFAFSFNFSIHGDKKRGIETIPPHGAVKFKPLIRTRRRGQRGGVDVVSVSSVRVHSKEQAEYLREHSQFGIAFFENLDSAMRVDVTMAQKMVEAQQSISRLSDMGIVARAKQEGLEVHSNIETMRKQLVEIYAKRSIEQHEKMLYGGIRSSVVDKDKRTIIEKTIG